MQRTGFVPIFAVFRAAANISDANDGVHVVHKHGAERTESWFHVDTETAIPVEKSARVA